jgi:serine/threonine protein kinase
LRALQDIDNLIGRVVDGRYRVLERIGTGAMAAIYRAEQDSEPKEVALKIIRPEIVQNRTVSARFHREAKAASKLKHPGIVRVLGWGFEDDVPYIAMELIDGEDLFEVLEREHTLPQAWSVLTAMRICEALSVAHAAGVVHRDLKPENIMVMPPDEEGQRIVKILDFGIAKLVDPVDFSEETVPQVLTKVGSAVGTPSHMAPEQARGGPVDGRTDIYAVGVLLYEMTTGHLPFEGSNPLLVAIQQVRDVPPPPSQYLPDLHPDFEKLILRALEKSPARRPQTADEMLAALNELFDTLVEEHKQSNAPPEWGIVDPPSADTFITSIDAASDDDGDDTLEGETDPTTLKRNIAGIRRLIDSMIGSKVEDPPSIDSVTQEQAVRPSIDDEPSTLDATYRTPRASSAPLLRRPYPEGQATSDDVITVRDGLARRSLDSEAPIVTVVIDSKPLVDAARSELDSEAPIATRVVDDKDVRDAVKQFEARRRENETPPTSVGPVFTSAPKVESVAPGTMRSASPSPAQPVPEPAASQGAGSPPPSEWAMSPRNYRGELDAMLKGMPRRPPAVSTLFLVLLVGAAVGALVWVLLLY